MRTIHHILSIGIILFQVALLSCGETIDEQFLPSSDYLKVSDVVIDGNEVKGTLHIQANCAWSISEDVEWLTVAPVQGNGDADVTLTTGVNPSSIEERLCKITVSTPDGIDKIVNLRQGRSDESLSVSVNSVSFGENGGTNTFTITSNSNWTITGGAEWISYSPSTGSGSGSVSIAVQTNTSEFNREVVLTVTGAGGSKQYITVTQAEKTVTLTIEPEKINAVAISNDYYFKIHGNATWGITVDDNTWIKLSSNEGNGEADITVSVDDNNTNQQRVAKIRVTSASNRIERICEITQIAATVPTVNSVDVSNIGRYVATVFSGFSSPLMVTEYGFVWSQSSNPTLENCGDNKVSSTMEGVQLSFEQTDSAGKNDVMTGGNHSFSLSSLKSGVTYHVRAYARNAVGVGYSIEMTFTTGGIMPGDDDNLLPNL